MGIRRILTFILLPSEDICLTRELELSERLNREQQVFGNHEGM